MNNSDKKVFVGMSGGVDSSVAAGLLKKQGYDVVGVHLKCFNLDGCADKDLEDARRAAEVLDIPFYVFDFEGEYKSKVMKYMVDGYKKGITPNPDVMCNKEIKFGLFLEKALEMGAGYVATGHYVRLVPRYISGGTGVRPVRRGTVPMFRPEIFASRKPSISGLRNCRAKHTEKLASFFSLSVAKDKNKDQSYFLWTSTQKQLKHCLFPLGDYRKPEVRIMAKKFGLLNADKKDSQGICFLGKIGLEDFLKKYIKPKKGEIIDTEGNLLGEHDGFYYYTIGQRHGLRLDSPSHLSSKRGGIAAKDSNRAPYYISDKILKTNTLVVAQGENNPALYKNEINLIQVNFINQRPKTHNKQQVWIRVRYRQPLTKAILVKSGKRQGGWKLTFVKPQKFVASGQSAVFYSKSGELLGGGIIK